MKYFFLIFCSVVLLIFSLKEIKPKLCINCKHFITDHATGRYGKCSLFPKNEGKINFLVNGKYDDNFYYCSMVRLVKDMCGEEGKKYKRKYVKKAE